jgi:hypothetical protein
MLSTKSVRNCAQLVVLKKCSSEIFPKESMTWARWRGLAHIFFHRNCEEQDKLFVSPSAACETISNKAFLGIKAVPTLPMQKL